MSQKELASAALLSQTMISGLERGEKSTRVEHIARIDDALNTNAALAQRWSSLQNYSGVPDWFSDIVLLEQEATGIKMFHMSVFPGLLQTEDYARAVVQTGRPWYPKADVDRLVTSRVKRREVLSKSERPLLWAVVDEDVVRRTVGGPEITFEQLGYVLELVESQLVQLQVIPDESRLKPGFDGAFRIMTFRDRPAAVYAEHVTGGEPVHDADKVEECHMLFGALQAEALPLAASTDLVRKARGDLYA
ncbi:transcriptional regulator with XRE-family HTH domain [Streptomonospora salina]|uniref:Transcriptional regulator with XRE-family HTH domain n=2 Tax=Streptomonospora salina TaxID=104205 RepID=A0A841E5W7_9ACTN|nr:transcriptional regulator with XRE-family HTH domain [Streptomonospora salina]